MMQSSHSKKAIINLLYTTRAYILSKRKYPDYYVMLSEATGRIMTHSNFCTYNNSGVVLK